MYNFRNLFTIFSIILVLIDLYFAYHSYRKHVLEGKYLGRASVFAAVVAFSYLISILEEDYFRASLMSSIYFVSIDWLLVTMLKLAIAIARRGRKWKKEKLMMALEAYAIFDTIVLMINPFWEIAVHYEHRNTLIACYEYQKMPLYYAHLLFTYLMVVAVLGIFIQKAYQAPRQYRNQYSVIVYAVLFVVIVNAFFILPRGQHLYNLLDVSIPGYSIGLLVIYWSCFEYRKVYLQHGLSNMVMDNMNQGVVLFDYDGYLSMKNHKADEMLPFIRPYNGMRSDLHMTSFLAMCGITAQSHEIGDYYSIQLFPDTGPKASGLEEDKDGLPGSDYSVDVGDPGSIAGDPAKQEMARAGTVRCDYRCLEDSNHERIGDLFVFTAPIGEIDIMTGYSSWEYFKEIVAENPDSFHRPLAVANFDINELSSINQREGQEAGDALIHTLAGVIRQCMPEEAFFVRGHDAHLIVIAFHTDEMEMRSYGEAVKEAYAGQFEVGYASSDSEDKDIFALILEAARAMLIKKLIDGDSARSQTISSLIRALKESDTDTEAHVKRTRLMGRELGRRIGLTDLQQSQLDMLCLLHDIGKVGIPLDILNKPGRLSDEEWRVLRTHPEKGYQIAVSSWELRDIAEMILYHHERWDGKGYPAGLSGEEIPLLSRVIAVVDACDAMLNNRSYRKKLSLEKVKRELQDGAGSQFDPRITEVFLQILEEKPDQMWEEVEERAAHVTEVEVRHEDQPSLGQKADSSSAREFSPVDFCRYELNLDDYIISADDNFERFTGYSQGDIVSRRLRQSDLIPADDKEAYFSEVDRQMAKGNLVYIEHFIQRKDGRRIYVLCYARKFYHSATKSLRHEIVIVDMARTKVKRAWSGQDTTE